MTRTREGTITRILVALDTSPHSQAALEAASKLAAELEAELVGLFVEDMDLLRLACLPFSRELPYAHHAERRLDTSTMERALRAEAEQARRSLATLAARLQVQWTFKVVRGQVVREVLTAAQEADLIFMGQASRRRWTTSRVGSTARTVARQASRTVAILRTGARLGKPVVVVFDGAGSAVAALATGASLAQEDHQNLVVLLAPPSPDGAEALEKQVLDWLKEQRFEARIVALRTPGSAEVMRAIQQVDGRLLVLAGDSTLCTHDALDALLSGTGCPIIVAR